MLPHMFLRKKPRDRQPSPQTDPKPPRFKRLRRHFQAEPNSSPSPTVQGEQPASVPANANPSHPITGADPKPQLPTKPVGEQTQTDDAELLRGIGRGAHVWTTYVKETKEFDDDMVDGWNRGLDVTLVFAALFSAILTAFVLESAKSLQPDPSDQTVAILREISQRLQGNAAGRSSTNLLDTADDVEFEPTRSAVWVNCLWFLSLSISIAVSLAAILAKQWCYYYLSARTGDTITQAEDRQKRYNGLTKWRMQGLLEHLPMFMHISLALFSVGLVIYLWDINVAVASTVTAVSLGALCFYLVTTLVPVWIPSCPYKTTQSVYVRVILDYLTSWLGSFRRYAIHLWSSSIGLAADIRSRDLQAWRSALGWSRNSQGLETETRDQALLTRLRSWFHRAKTWITNRVASSAETAREPDLEQAEALSEPKIRRGNFASSPPNLHHSTVEPSPPSSLASSSSSASTDNEADPFVKDALEWLIFNSQNSSSIDTAIGALAIGKVRIEDETLRHEINSHLVKHFSDCFSSSGKGARLQLVHRQDTLKYALDYVNWISYFAGGSRENISKQVSQFISAPDGQIVTGNLGLAFASLADQKNLSPEASKNVAFWLAALIECYDQGALYLSEDILSAFVDGLSITGRSVREPDISKRAETLIIPCLINILWKVSHMDKSVLRSSIGLNLAVFALTTSIPYPSKRNFDSAARYLAYDYRSPHSRNASYISFTTFALIGFLNSESQLGLDERTIQYIHRIIHETEYLARPDLPMRIPQQVELDPLRRYLTPMLIERMIPILSGVSIPYHLFYTAFEDDSVVNHWERRTYQTVLQGVCHLITDHMLGTFKLYNDGIIAATDLFFREVQRLPKLDSAIINPNTLGEIADGPSTSYSRAAVQDAVLNAKTPELMASLVLALILKQSENKQCLETAVRAVLSHLNNCNTDLVMKAATWFSKTPHASEEQEKSIRERELLHMCGYIRILTAMTVRCTDPTELAGRLFGHDKTHPEARLHQAVEEKLHEYSSLAEATHDTHLHAFGISGLVVWRFACSDKTFTADATRQPLAEVWDLIAKHAEYLRPEALEALLDTIVLLTAVTEPSSIISHSEAQTLLRLLDLVKSEIEERVRPVLAVALTFCGLCLDADDWDFWPFAQRKECWRIYIKSGNRKQDAPALYLLGLSRLLAHYKPLRLDHTSIKTIATEIDRYMQQHSSSSTVLTLPFLTGFDVRRHVRECVWEYLQETESHAPFTLSTSAFRDKLRSALQYDGGEGFLYEVPQPFTRRERDVDVSF
ncbi:hypothetical protein FRC12_009074 [Ceratobasidium sp. 428]|nr:hypothetical protein FRC12_009074 [Ceratobasidium sp. 428]